MNPQAINDAFRLFASRGYKGDEQEFISLISSNPQAFDDAYRLFASKGYKGGEDGFSNLMGIGKKKDEELPSTTPEEDVDLSTKEEQEQFLSGTLSDEGIEDKEALASLVEYLEARPKTKEEAQAQLIEERIEEQKRFEEQVKPEIDEEKLAELDLDAPKTRAEAEAMLMEERIEKGTALREQQPALVERQREEFEEEYLSDVDKMLEKEVLKKDKQFIEDTEQDFAQYYGMDGDAAVRSLQEQFGKYGITFEKEGRTYGGSIKAKSFDGEEYLIPLNQHLKDTERGKEISQEFKSFIERTARKPKTEISKIEEEGVKFYGDRGIDYLTFKDMQERYDNNISLIKFLEKAPFNEPDEMDEDSPYKDMYIDGVLRADYRDLINKAKVDNKSIRDYLYSKDVYDTRVDFDLKLQQNAEKLSNIAREYNNAYLFTMADLDKETQKLFGIPISNLPDYKPTNELDQRRKDYLLHYYNEAKEQKKLAAEAYAIATSYIDEKYDKQLSGELVEGMKAFTNAVSAGHSRGQAAEVILSIAMGLTDISDDDSSMEAARKIMEHLDDADTGKFSVGDRAYHNAQSNWEVLRALRNRPLELMGAFVGQSFAQMLPIGSKLVPTAVGAGAGTGALGFTPISVLGGAALGLNAGMAATNVAIEYTNAVLDAMTNQGFDVTDPQQVQEALQSEEVWSEGREIGLKRGLTIGAVDFLGGKFAGKMIPTSKLASSGTKFAAQVVERIAIDPALEMLGETLAQAAAGQDLNFSEILAEGLGAIGSNAAMGSLNQMISNQKNTITKIANDLSDLDTFMDDNILDRRVLSWTDRQEKMGRIDSDKAQQIRNNISTRNEAREIMNVGQENKQKPSKNPEAEKRLAKLINAKKELTSTEATQEAFSEQISAIDKEIKEIARTGDVVAVEQQADLSALERRIQGVESVFEDTLKVAALTEEEKSTEVVPIKTNVEQIEEVSPTKQYSFEFEEGQVPPELQDLEAESETTTTEGKVTLTFSGQQLIDAGLATQEETQEEVIDTEIIEIEDAAQEVTVNYEEKARKELQSGLDPEQTGEVEVSREAVLDRAREMFNEDVSNLMQTVELEEKTTEITEEVDEKEIQRRGSVINFIREARQKGISELAINAALKKKGYSSQDTKAAKQVIKRVAKKVKETKKKLTKKTRLSIRTILGKPKNVKRISFTEKQLLIKRLKALREGARDAKKALERARKMMSEEVLQLVKDGKITTKQMSAVIKRLGTINFDNPIAIENFVDYMTKVFNDADYVSKVSKANKKRTVATKNTQKKLGIAEPLVEQLLRIFNVKATLIPDSVFQEYLKLIDIMGVSDRVIKLPPIKELKDMAGRILSAIDLEQSQIPTLIDRIRNSEHRVLNDDGSLNYAQTIKAMLDNQEMTNEEYEVAKKYKSQIQPRKEREQMTEQEAAKEKASLVDSVSKTKVNHKDLPSQDERNLAKTLADLIKTDAINGLDNLELKNLLKLLDNINNGYLPHFAQIMVERLNSINDGKQFSNAVERGKPLPVSFVYSKIKSLITKKDSIYELIRRNPLYYIDQLFGDFKTKDIFNAVFGAISKAYANLKTDLAKVNERIKKAEDKVMASFGRDPNAFLMSKYKQMVYMIQLEFNSNPDNKQVNQAADFIRATIKRIRQQDTRYSEADAKMLEQILKDFNDGTENIDAQKLYDSFNQAERESIQTIQDINKELQPLAVYTSTIIRGEKIDPLNNYVHLNTIKERGSIDETADISFVDNVNERMKPSTKAKSLIERTGKVSPLNFDIYASAYRGSKFILTDYHLTAPARTARRTLNIAEKNLGEDMPAQQRQILNAVVNAFEEALSTLLLNQYYQTSIADDIVDFMAKQGYRAVLAGVRRFISELTSNLSFAIILNPKAFIQGMSMNNVVMSATAPNAMRNLNSKQTGRLYPDQDLTGKLVDVNIINQATGVKGGRAKGSVSNILTKYWNNTAKIWVNGVQFVADSLISTPDKIVTRPLWFGSFNNRFKKLTGVNPDFDKIAANDTAYMEKYSAELKEATDHADEQSTLAAATDNAFMGILKGTVKPNQSAMLKAFHMFNNFLTRFLIFEYVAARTGVMNMIGRGELGRRQGAALLAAVLIRMTVYTLLTHVLKTKMLDLFGEDEEEEFLFSEDKAEKGFGKRVGQAIASTLTSMLLGRDFGNATRSIINLGIEKFNENNLEFLRDGEYDMYDDAIQFSAFAKDPKKREGIGDFIIKMAGPFGPTLKTLDFAIRELTDEPKQKKEAIERQNLERMVRIPLELLGILGFIPVYKDVRTVVNDKIYKDLRDAKNKPKEATKKELLQGYDSEQQMKNLDYELWEMTFGENAPDYDHDAAMKEIERELDMLYKEMNNELNMYKPKQ